MALERWVRRLWCEAEARPRICCSHAETLLVLLVLGVALVIGLATAAITGCRPTNSTPTITAPRRLHVHERLADRSQFETVEEYLWM